jgi:hypothetical protein
MSAIGDGCIGHGGLPILDEDYTPHKNIPTTDDIASRYKKRITQGISSKLLKFNKTLIPPSFTQEEMAYIKKDAEDNDPAAEVKVITPDPTITLKKGNTEINIKNAATLVRKMAEIYPNPNKSATFAVDSDASDAIEFSAPLPIIPPQPDIKTVNKNAYEIRTEVLCMALEWVKYKSVGVSISNITDDDVLNTAQKFYRFVENRR